MFYSSILYKDNFEDNNKISKEPPCFTDLNLDRIVNSVISGKEEYNLKPFFYTPAPDIETILYRQEAAKDIEHGTLFEDLKSFAHSISTVRRYIRMIEKLNFMLHREGWFLEAVIVYCDAVISLEKDLLRADLKSNGLLKFREYLTHYVQSPDFTSIHSEALKLKSDISSIQYLIEIKNEKVTVRKYKGEKDYSTEIKELFSRFTRGESRKYLSKVTIPLGMNHIEARIMDCVAKLRPGVFYNLHEFSINNNDFMDSGIISFAREIQFYISWLDYIAKMKNTGFAFCYPEFSASSKNIHCHAGFDLALAHKLSKENMPVVCNDFYLTGKERIIVVSGPNQGGKTTFARDFGQIHYIGSLGLTVPGREARLYLFDDIFTHFEKGENISDLRGKLQDDLIRIEDFLSRATTRSIIIMNEIFTSTTLHDAVFLSGKIMERINSLDLICVWITFVDELSEYSESTVSMVSSVDPDAPEIRTFKISRRPADGLAYAMSISEKYGLTYNSLIERIKT